MLAVLVTLTLVLAIEVTSPRSAAAVQEIGTGSCGVALANCENLPANYTIGDDSRSVADACDNLQDGVVIGDNYCTDANACAGAGGQIGSNSCILLLLPNQRGHRRKQLLPFFLLLPKQRRHHRKRLLRSCLHR